MTIEANKTSPQSPQDKEINFNFEAENKVFAKDKEYSKLYISKMHHFFTIDMPEMEQFDNDTFNTNLIRFNH